MAASESVARLAHKTRLRSSRMCVRKQSKQIEQRRKQFTVQNEYEAGALQCHEERIQRNSKETSMAGCNKLKATERRLDRNLPAQRDLVGITMSFHILQTEAQLLQKHPDALLAASGISAPR